MAFLNGNWFQQLAAFRALPLKYFSIPSLWSNMHAVKGSPSKGYAFDGTPYQVTNAVPQGFILIGIYRAIESPAQLWFEKGSFSFRKTVHQSSIK